MKLTNLADFDFALPQELIAQHPLRERSASRLLHLEATTGAIAHKKFPDIVDLLNPGDLIVFNDTKVIPARLFANKTTGAKVEILIERILNDTHALAQLGANKAIKIGTELIIENKYRAKAIGKKDNFFQLEFAGNEPILAILKKVGHIPLPPYINRAAAKEDAERYQTIFAKHEGAVAAPTAGLHFDEELLSKIAAKGIKQTHITLHVGAGTFQPIKTEDITKHKMHAEYINVEEQVCAKINATRAAGRRIIAVGTTCVRSLETAAQNAATITPYEGETNIFIYPGYKFKCVDAIITNFHLPKSTLIMLVCAFGGYENVMRAYREAIEMKYRFFSYGDAMLLTK